MHRLTNILHYILFVFILILMTPYIALQLPPVQTYAVNKAIAAVREMFDAEIELGSFRFKPFNTVVIKDMAVIDKNPCAEDARDTLLKVGGLSVRLSLFSLIGPGHQDVILKEVKIRDTEFNLVIEEGEYGCNLVRMFKLLPQEEPEPMPEKDILNIRSIQADNLTFTMRNYAVPDMDVPPTAINWSNMGVDRINLRARNFRISHGLFYANVDHLDFLERTGWHMQDLRADLVAGKGLVDIRNIYLNDGSSYAHIDYSMTGNSNAYQDYVNKVIMEARIYESRWSLQALAHFIPPLNPDPDTFVRLTGRVKGPVANLQGDRLCLDFEKSTLGFTLNGGVSRLPDVDNMTFNADFSKVTFKTDDVCRAVNSIAPGAKLDLKDLGRNLLYSARIKVDGPINDMLANVDLNQGKDRGTAKLTARIMNVLKTGRPPIAVNGRIATEEFDLKPFTGAESELGRLSFSTALRLTVPSAGNELEIEADSLNIRKLQFKGHNYRQIRGKASLCGSDISAGITANEQALKANLDLWSDKDRYYGSLMVHNADLRALNIDNRDISEVSFNVGGSLGKDIDKLQGDIRISDIVLANTDGVHKVDDIDLKADTDNGIYDISLDSEVANAVFKGNRNAFDASFEALSTESLLAFMLPGFYIEHGTWAEARLDTSGNVSGKLRSGRIAFNKNYTKDLYADVSGTLEDIRAEILSSEIHAADFEMNNNIFNASLSDNTLGINYRFSNTGTDAEKNLRDGEFNVGITSKADEGLSLDISPSRFNMDGKEWTLPSSKARFNGRDIEVEGFTLSSSDQWLEIDGRTSSARDGMLTAAVHNLDLSLLNRFIKGDIALAGSFNANGAILSPFNGTIPEFELNADAKNLSISGTDLGDVSINGICDRAENRINIGLNEHIGGQTPLNAEAVYRPLEKSINAIAYIDRLPIGFAGNFLPDIFSSLGGTLSGRVSLDGPVSNPDISCTDGRFNDAMVEVAFTHVPYYVNGSFNIDNNGIHFGNALVTDRYDGRGKATGGLAWKKFREMALDLHFDVTDIEAIDIPSSEPGIFYGHIFANGKVDITGPFNSITLSVDGSTANNSDLHLVMSGPIDAARGNLLTFHNPYEMERDPYEDLLRKFRTVNEADRSNFKVRLRALANPQINVSLDLGSTGFAAGLSGNGNGTIELMLDSNPADFKIYGDYTVNEGTFNMNASNLVHRLFNISSGSSIKFEGDPMESPLNLDAVYQAKASIATLIADTSSVSNRRQVNCGIHIQNTLNNPSVDFSIDIPDLDPSVKSRVESALSTDDKIQKQFLSLLLSNNFLPDEQSGIVNNSSLLYSNVSELMANQVNNIFTKLDIPLDLGLNYQPSETGGSNLFDVALSTQLFNNRVIIGGTLGNRQNASSGNDALFGDLDIQFKVIRSGALRLSAFSHSVDQYTNALDNAQRNGIGVTWQQEFNSFPKWFMNLFYGKSKREELEAVAAEEEKKTKTLILDE